MAQIEGTRGKGSDNTCFSSSVYHSNLILMISSISHLIAFTYLYCNVSHVHVHIVYIEFHTQECSLDTKKTTEHNSRSFRLLIILNNLPLTCLSLAIDNSDFTLTQSVRGLIVGISVE